VNLTGVRLQRLQVFGDVWLALGLWRLLGLDELLRRLMPPGREDVPWPVVAAILAVARFCEPSSELPIEDTLYRPTALDDLVGVAPEQVHILVCFLAYAMWKTLAQWMRAGGLGDAPRTVLEEFARVKSGDVVLTTRRANGQPGATVRLRCVTAPDEGQRVLLSRLGLTLPQRLRRVDEVAKCSEDFSP
jgi:hypothetical protein